MNYRTFSFKKENIPGLARLISNLLYFIIVGGTDFVGKNKLYVKKSNFIHVYCNIKCV